MHNQLWEKDKTFYCKKVIQNAPFLTSLFKNVMQKIPFFHNEWGKWKLKSGPSLTLIFNFLLQNAAHCIFVLHIGNTFAFSNILFMLSQQNPFQTYWRQGRKRSESFATLTNAIFIDRKLSVSRSQNIDCKIKLMSKDMHRNKNLFRVFAKVKKSNLQTWRR